MNLIFSDGNKGSGNNIQLNLCIVQQGRIRSPKALLSFLSIYTSKIFCMRTPVRAHSHITGVKDSQEKLENGNTQPRMKAVICICYHA